jgi:23S rRNA (uracil1939-C5)-methyltransferase
VGGRCGGCPWIQRPYADQLEAKRTHLRQLWQAAQLPSGAVDDLDVSSPGLAGLRDRTDVSWRRTDAGGVLGMWDLAGEELVAIGPCPALSPPLRGWLAVLQADPPPIGRASLRLRVAPDGTRGLWIDAANADIRGLMDEGAWLRRQLGQARVELGQKRKPLVDHGPAAGGLKLSKEAHLWPWFQTWLTDERPVPLYGPVGGFTQPSLAANRLLVRQAMAQVQEAGAGTWLEVGAGQGNFTLPLAHRARRVVAVEQDPLALQGLERSAREAALEDRIRVVDADMQRPEKAWARWQAALAEAEGLLADPPRSGLVGLASGLAALPAGARPRQVLYVSCHAESLVGDVARLVAGGYRVARVSGVDQFPQTPHAEWLVHLCG